MGTPHRLLILLFLAASFAVSCGSRGTVTDNDTKSASAADNRRAQSARPPATPTPEGEVDLGNGLKIVPKEIALENDRLRYKIGLTYPQIEDSKDARISRLNREIKRLVSQYSWMLNPTAKDLGYYQEMHPEAFNTFDSDYEVVLASKRIVSIYIEIYSYGIGAAHAVQQSITVNYDLGSGRLLRLGDILKDDLKYLQFVSRYCIEDLRKRFGNALFEEELTPRTKNYQSWNITKEAIRINFDACKVHGCMSGKQAVLIPFDQTKASQALHELVQ
jgi:hypothetical protein